jgi:hypothetical protein
MLSEQFHKALAESAKSEVAEVVARKFGLAPAKHNDSDSFVMIDEPDKAFLLNIRNDETGKMVQHLVFHSKGELRSFAVKPRNGPTRPESHAALTFTI